VLFPYLELRLRKTAVDWWTRVGPTLSVGRVAAREVPEALEDLRRYRPLLDVDIGWMLAVGATLFLNSHVGMAPMITVAMPQLPVLAREQGTLYDNNSIALGLGLGLTWRTLR
jgi:hypothetical protein